MRVLDDRQDQLSRGAERLEFWLAKSQLGTAVHGFAWNIEFMFLQERINFSD